MQNLRRAETPAPPRPWPWPLPDTCRAAPHSSSASLPFAQRPPGHESLLEPQTRPAPRRPGSRLPTVLGTQSRGCADQQKDSSKPSGSSQSSSSPACCILVHPPWTDGAASPFPEPSDTHPVFPGPHGSMSPSPQFSQDPQQSQLPPPIPTARMTLALHSPSWLLGGASAGGGWGLGSSLLCS